MSIRLTVNVTRRAAREISEASDWWADNRPKAPEAFREELKRAFDLIATQPGIGSQARSKRLRGE